jgi:outer membrane protein insertion porin family
MGVDPILRSSQLQINPVQYDTLISTLYGCPNLNSAYACTGGQRLNPGTFKPNLSPVPGTNWVLRMSTGLELQTMLPVVNAPFRIYYAYNALRLDSSASPPIQITRSMFPCPVQGDPTCTAYNAGTYTYNLARSTLGSNFTLLEPRKTFRFSVATTF